MFAKMKGLFSNSANQITGRLDVLQAVTAAGAAVASADGSISDKEIAAVQKSVKSNQTLASAFPATEINKTLEIMIGRAEGGRVGRIELFREIEEVASKGDTTINTIVLAGAIDVAEAEEEDGSPGKIDEKEMKELEKIAGKLGLKLGDFL